MNVNQITKINKKGPRYISALLLIHGIRQDDIAAIAGVSKPLVSLVVTRKRGGTKKHGPKIRLVREAVAQALGVTVDELWPDKAA
ncbi:MAG: helix-turn-helix transcriptional regulator [Smithellaceae bacterium]|jgi:predicted transcriptional regulator|nr:helix-turn-helix transcriptional regulator [Smithellaceae bacterium]